MQGTSNESIKGVVGIGRALLEERDVAGYRLYCLNDRNEVTARHDFDAENDEAAIAFAKAHHVGQNCEIWELGRRVATLSGSPAG